MASAPEKMATLELTADSARALVQAGRLRELIGVAPNASLEEVRGACKRALLRFHPDKGGDPEVFKEIQPALQQEERFYDFEGEPPPWAKEQLAQIAKYRREVEEATTKLHEAMAEAESATERGRAKATAVAARNVENKERWVENANVSLSYALSHFKACYAQHIENEQQRKEEEKREAAAQERQRLQERREVRALQRRRERGMSKNRFPTLPRAFTDKAAVDAFTALRRKYTAVLKTIWKYKRQGRDATESESRAADLLQQARAHVQHWCGVAHEVTGDRSKRFPQLPSQDPRHDEMANLRRQHTRLKDRVRKAKSEEHKASLQAQVDITFAEAIALRVHMS